MDMRGGWKHEIKNISGMSQQLSWAELHQHFLESIICEQDQNHCQGFRSSLLQS